MPEISHFQPMVTTAAATIANGAALSGVIDLRGTTLVGVHMPAAWTAASLTFQGSIDGTTFVDLYSASGGEVTVSADASRFITLSPSDFAGLRYLKLRSGTSGTPVNQGAERAVTLVVRAI